MLSRQEIEDCRNLISVLSSFIDTHLYKHMHEDVPSTKELCQTLTQRLDEELNEQGLE